jgi:molybdopterin synthase catalytic subunit
MAVRVQPEWFDAGRELTDFLNDKRNSGGVATFNGIVRDRDKDDPIAAMTLEHYPSMTEEMLDRIEMEARRRWDLDDCLIIHRYGRLKPGDPIVMVLTASTHRKAAFEACEFLVDWLKSKAPFWKIEETVSGMTRWVEARATDDAAADRWTQSQVKNRSVD